MGYWNATCGISHLPITDNTPTVLVVIGENAPYNRERFAGFSYPLDLWRPRTLPIFGTYNTYGSIEVGKTPCLPFIEKTLVEWGGKANDESLATYLERLSRGDVRAKTDPVGQMLIRRDIWDFLLGVEWAPRWGSFSLSQTEADAREWLKFIEDYVAQNENNQLKLFGGMFAAERHFMGRRTGFFDALTNLSSGPLFFLGSDLVDRLAERKMSSEEALEVLLNYGRMVHINGMMMGLRMFWSPQSGAGSQDTGWELYAALAGKVAEIAQAGVKENYEGDDD